MHQQQKAFFLEQVDQILEQHFSEDFHVQELANHLFLSRVQLFRKIKQLTGDSPTTFIRQFRLIKGQILLKNSSKPIKEIAYEIGFKDPAHFTNAYKNLFGIPPKIARK